MVRCCRPLQSRPSCYNLHRVRVDVRRLRPLASTAASARGGAAGESGAGGAQGGGPRGNPRSRFRYGPGESGKERERGIDREIEIEVVSEWVNENVCMCLRVSEREMHFTLAFALTVLWFNKSLCLTDGNPFQ